MKRARPLKRKTPLRSKRATPRRAARPAGCAVRGCKATEARVRVSETERYCRKHATKKADDTTREFVRRRDPRCVACGDPDRGVQWSHVVTRGARFIRWDAENACGLCSGCHYAYTQSPGRWLSFVERRWPGRLVRLLHRELYAESIGGHVDVAEVILAYRAGRPWSAPDPPAGWAAEEERQDPPA